jgi:hypothetical protein
MTKSNIKQSSFRDPSGFLFTRDGVLYRQVNQSYREHYDYFVQSGLYNELLERKLIVPHKEVSIEPELPQSAYKIIQPLQLDFISYPYEWCFSELKDAALLTLELQQTALKYEMSLKDASAFNVQFLQGRPVLIDSLSFEKRQQGQPWIAYRQFCQHFLAPLSLMAQVDIRLNQLLRVYIDGLPLDLTSRLLPVKTWFGFSTLAHIHLHARSQQRYSGRSISTSASSTSMTATRIVALIDGLIRSVEKLTWKPAGTEWADYYEASHNYESESLGDKARLVEKYIELIHPETVWDLGANTGRFSRIGSQQGIPTYAFDIDPGAVELNYLQMKVEDERNLLPLLMDLTNPSGGIGWASEERMSLVERGPAGVVLALALLHHLAIGNNLPFDLIAGFFSSLSEWLVIEFIPKDDPQVQRMLLSRPDIFVDYTQENFVGSFSAHFEIVKAEEIKSSKRSLYLMRRRHDRKP